MPDINLFNEILLGCILIAAIFIIVSESIIRNIIALSMFGIFIALDFIILKSNLVALTEVVVGAVFVPLFFVIAYTKMNNSYKNESGENYSSKTKENAEVINIKKRGENN